MATRGEPLWIRSFETGREILNYDEYMKEFSVENLTKPRAKGSSVEASRDSGVVFMDPLTLVQCFMDVVRNYHTIVNCHLSNTAESLIYMYICILNFCVNFCRTNGKNYSHV